MARIEGRGRSGAATNELVVDKNGRAATQSDTRLLQQQVNQVASRVWSIPFEDRDPTCADDYFLYLQNTGPNDIHVYEVHIESTVAGSMEIHRVTGTPANGTGVTVSANTIVNKKLGNTNSPDAVTEVGVNITCITVAGVLHQEAIVAVNETVRVGFSEHIIIPQGEALALLWDTATGILSGGISFFEDVTD